MARPVRAVFLRCRNCFLDPRQPHLHNTQVRGAGVPPVADGRSSLSRTSRLRAGTAACPPSVCRWARARGRREARRHRQAQPPPAPRRPPVPPGRRVPQPLRGEDRVREDLRPQRGRRRAGPRFHLPGEIIGLDAILENRHGCSAKVLETSAVCELPFDRLEELAATGAQPAAPACTG